MKFYRGSINKDSYLCIVHVKAGDHIMIKLAKECNFPRGFPIYYKPNSCIQTYGFYPKFENDDRQFEVHTSFLDKFISSKIRITMKWSGFLGQLIVLPDKTWTVTTKNSANINSEYIN